MNVKHAGIGMTSQRTRDRMVTRLREKGIQDEVVLGAMSSVPRHIFVDEAMAHLAYDDVSFPLGYGQTISQPYIVARMIEILRKKGNLIKVLEIGTGCGYQAAILGQVAHTVYSVERIQPLHQRALKTLQELNARNVELTYADGTMGRPELAPFDGIIMAAAATHVPQALLAQLAIGGRLVMPLGAQEQVLTLIERNETGFVQSHLEAVKFVPILAGKA
jgi:protein-L-isoaspartate(D-aspartate) O-methyltransferase